MTTATETRTPTRPGGSRRRRNQRGQVVVLFAGAILALIALCAVVTDVAWYWTSNLRMQRAADAAALGGVTVDGVYGPRTQAAGASYQSAHGLLATGVADRPVWLALQRRGYPYLEYRLTVLRYGSEGAAVSALQRALGINPTGWFGPITEGKVKAFQKASSITQTGVVATLTWTALDRRDGR